MARTATNPGIGAPRSNAGAAGESGSSLDLASILGLLAGFSLIATAMILGGSPTAFVDIPAICIVVGGTFAVTAISFTPHDMLRTQGVIMKALTQTKREPAAAAYQMLDFAEKVTKASAEVEESDRQALRDAGFTDRDIFDIASVVGFFSMSNRVASAVAMQPNDEYHAAAR